MRQLPSDMRTTLSKSSCSPGVAPRRVALSRARSRRDAATIDRRPGHGASAHVARIHPHRHERVRDVRCRPTPTSTWGSPGATRSCIGFAGVALARRASRTPARRRRPSPGGGPVVMVGSGTGVGVWSGGRRSRSAGGRSGGSSGRRRHEPPQAASSCGAEAHGRQREPRLRARRICSRRVLKRAAWMHERPPVVGQRPHEVHHRPAGRVQVDDLSTRLTSTPASGPGVGGHPPCDRVVRSRSTPCPEEVHHGRRGRAPRRRRRRHRRSPRGAQRAQRRHQSGDRPCRPRADARRERARRRAHRWRRQELRRRRRHRRVPRHEPEEARQRQLAGRR